ncbi:recQ-mediated genome instability protein 1 [Podila clonocystis]|nr:recQ-mediated genome instability protein 1 [Podila clonocystis]
MIHVASQDDLVIRNAIQLLGVNASVEWIRQCIEFRRTMQAKGTIPSSSTSTKDIANFVYQMYLLADFRTLEPTPILPSTVSTPHRQRLFTDHGADDNTGVILQILQIQDISNSSLKLLENCEALGIAGDQLGGFQVGKALPRGMCALDLTDGVRKIRAFAMEPIPDIALEMKLGAKIRVKNAQVRHGVLQLYPTNTVTLGGEVASMNKYPRRLVVMNQMREKLGYPVEPYPTSPTDSPTAAVTTTTSPPLTFGAPTRPQSTSWTNPRPAVTAQDAVPSNTTNNRPSFIAPPKNTVTNPFKPAGRTDSPDYEALFYQEQQEEKPQEEYPWENDFDSNWDYDPAMDMDFNMEVDEPPKTDTRDTFDDDFDMPGDVADWEVLSQLSVDDPAPPKTKPSPITGNAQMQQAHDFSRNKIKEDSPPLVATLSPAKRGLKKRLPNLKAPRVGESSQLGISDWSVSKSQTRSVQESMSVSTRGRMDSESGDDYANKKERQSSSSLSSAKSRSVSPERVVIKQESNEASRHKRQEPEHVMDSDGDFETRPVAPVFVLDDSNKKYTFGNQKDEQLHRERSRSVSMSRWIEEDSRSKKDPPSGMVKVKTEPGLEVLDNDTRLKKVKQELTDERLMSTPTSTSQSTTKTTAIASRTGNEMATGSSVHAAIDLLSDDDNVDDGADVHSDPAYGLTSLYSPLKRIKTEPGSTFAAATTADLVVVKKEEVMFEFDMDDDDFGGLMDLTQAIPLVHLEEVKDSIEFGREVRTKAKISRLGKFSLTTLAMSIPVYLEPIPLGSGVTGDGMESSGYVVEVVLDQSAMETLMDCTVVEFRDLVRVNETRAKQLVQNFRLKLQDVDTIECRLNGQRAGVPVIRELDILSRKPPKS